MTEHEPCGFCGETREHAEWCHYDRPWPNPEERCWDCGSTIAHTHTALCEMSDPTDDLSLPMVEGTQWWTQ